MTTVRTGLETLLSGESSLLRDLLRGRSIGLICNQSTLGPGFRHAVDLLAERSELKLGALFGPEHGVRGEAQDMIPVEAGGAEGTVDRRTGVPVHSLYGDTFDSLTPTQDMLHGLDVLVFDVQDVGSRYYTYAATLVLSMRAAKAAGLPVVVLDRPNPLGGVHVEGGLVRDGFFSFVGLFPIPVRHGMTVGEIALWANDRLGIGCELHVIPMQGWSRNMVWEDTGLPFIPPSPNMPTADTARVYPGMCLVEGTNLSEARGTTRPFEQSGAPFLDADELAERLNARNLPGVHFRPCVFRPVFHKHGGEGCRGVFLHVTDRDSFRPYESGLAFIYESQRMAPEQFAWRTERYEYVDDVPAFDLLTGTDAVRHAFDRGEWIDELLGQWREEEEEFREERKPFLLYR